MPINADDIPRYAPPTFAELEEMFREPRNLCEECAHCIDVVDNPERRGGRIRLLSICVSDHDRNGDTTGIVITEPMETCREFEE